MIIKYLHKIISVFVLLLFFSGMIVGQTVINESKYDSLKRLGLINNSEQFDIVLGDNVGRQSGRFNPPGSTYIQAISPSDDGSSALISLPFDFCFWGDPENQVYINNNGNVSFDQIFTSGTPFNLPFSNFKVIAPFWSDVDTRARGGVYYKLLPNALIVNWQDVGHFDKSNSRGNSYQLIITDGSSELLPFGYTVGFFYDKIEWTAGDASGGVGGFGGAPAIIGMNLGDGVHFAQAGKFDKNDTTFVADNDTLNGVKQLIDKHIYFNPCDSLNNRPGLMGAKLRDTIGVCVGDTLNETFYFLSPESDQQTYVRVQSNNFNGFTVLNTTTDQMATADIEVIGSIANMGFHTISFTVVDNGIPNQLMEFDVVVQIDSLPVSLQISGDSSICEYEQTNLSVPNQYEEYLWSSGENTSTINATPGTYSVTVTHHKCEAKAKHLVKAHIPIVNIIGPKYICSPDTISLSTPSGNDAYLWSTGDTTNQIDVDQSGMYVVTVTDESCIKQDSFEVNILRKSLLIISKSDPNSCNGDSVTLSIPNDFDSVIWSNGDSTNSTKVLSGTHSVTVTVNSGNGTVCTVSKSVTIGAASIIPVSVVGDSLICGEENAIYNVFGSYDTYEWDNGSFNSASIYDSAGAHWLAVTTGTCKDTAYFTVIQNPLPNLQIQGNLFYCDTVDSARLVAVGGPWDSLFWNTGDITDTIYTGFGWKKATAWKDGCKSVEDFPVNELINGVDVKGITEICPGQSTRLDVEFGFDFYQWNTGAIGFSTLVSAPGDYWCVVHLDTCSATTDTITVTLNAPDSVKILGDTVMCDTAGGFIYADIGFKSFTWSTGERTPGIQYTSPGVYSVTVEDNGFCVTSDTVDIKQLPPVLVEIVGDSHYCYQDSSVLSVGIFDSYLWSNGDTTQSVKVRAGVYSISVANSDGCRTKDLNFKVVATSPIAKIWGDTGVCDNELGRLFTSSLVSDSVIWSTGNISDTINVFPGVYSLTLIDRYGCRADSTYDYLGLFSPDAGIQMNPNELSQAYSPVKFIDDSDLKGEFAKVWFWNVNDSIYGSSMDTSMLFLFGANLVIVHSVTLENGCTDSTSVPYRISSDIVKTNVITPNGDGVNDYLEFPNIQKYDRNELIIFNRWGVEIARFPSYRNFWDANGVPDGVYYYTLYLEDGVPPVKGNFTVIR